ncbi:MAG: hypothetical protein NTY19_24945 [Planctomycetota bacterium]|nr:hypothetical protein [Planctomycetota bacterium]
MNQTADVMITHILAENNRATSATWLAAPHEHTVRQTEGEKLEVAV